MANQLYTPEQAARSSIAALRYVSVLPRTVNQALGSEFVPGLGATINIPAPIELSSPDARTYTPANRAARDAIVFDEVAQTHVPVKMDTQAYKAVRLPDDFVTFSLQSLEKQVLAPMMQSVAAGVSAPLIAEMQGTADAAAGEGGPVKVAADGSDVLAALIKARAVLNKRNVPFAGRTFAFGPAIEAALLSLPQLQKVNESGDDGVLREATIGRLFGFDLISAPELGDKVGVAYESDAFALITRPSAAPQGAAFASVVSQDGFSLRYLQHYNPLQLEDQAVIDAFVGAETIDPRRAVKVTQS